MISKKRSRVKEREIIAKNLSKGRWTAAWVSAVDPRNALISQTFN
jgi:hypothetical protein